MSDLISREAAIKMICEGGYMTAALAKVEALPTIDAEPVRHGYWLWRDEWTQVIGEPTEHETGWECSVCHTELESYIYEAISESAEIEGYEPKMEYCPKCGAKMDLEDDE